MADTGAVKSADRVLALLSFVAERQPVRFNDLLESFDLPRSSAHGLLKTMVARGWLEHDPELRSYSLGISAWQAGQRYTGHRDVAALAQSEMDRLAATVGETVQLARLDGVDNVYIAMSEAPRPIRLVSSVGVRLPAYATGLGKALLSQLPAEKARARLAGLELRAFTEHTITDLDVLLATLEEVRTLGYSVDNEEYLPGTCCVAVPMFSSKNLTIAMSITAPTSRRDEHWPQGPLSHLLQTAERIRHKVGVSLGA